MALGLLDREGSAPPEQRIALVEQTAELGAVHPRLLDELELQTNVRVQAQEQQPPFGCPVGTLVHAAAPEQAMAIHAAQRLRLAVDGRSGIPRVAPSNMRTDGTAVSELVFREVPEVVLSRLAAILVR